MNDYLPLLTALLNKVRKLPVEKKLEFIAILKQVQAELLEAECQTKK